jgi:hypothetical protein
MSPGWSIAIASAAERTASLRCTDSDPRPSIRSLRERSMVLRGQNPSAQARSSALRSGGMDRRDARLASSSAGSKMASTLSPSMSSTR